MTALRLALLLLAACATRPAGVAPIDRAHANWNDWSRPLGRRPPEDPTAWAAPSVEVAAATELAVAAEACRAHAPAACTRMASLALATGLPETLAFAADALAAGVNDDSPWTLVVDLRSVAGALRELDADVPGPLSAAISRARAPKLSWEQEEDVRLARSLLPMGLDGADVKPVMDRANESFSECLGELVVATPPTAGGIVRLHFEIGPGGTPWDVRFDAPADDAQLAACLREVAKGLRFPTPRGLTGGTVEVHYPVALQP